MTAGLTGGVASGKSLVSGELRRLGAHVIDADVISREITRPGSPVYKELIKEFGKEILKDNRELDRKALGKIVFSDPEKLKKLNSMTHPVIIDEIEKRVLDLKERDRDGLIVVDAALLVEVGLHRKMSKVVVVYADEDKRIERLMRRDNLNKREARERLRAQMPLEEKRQYADFVIDNNGSIEDTLASVRELFGKLKAK